MTTIATPAGDVTIAWSEPEGSPSAALVLAHGAGGTLDSAGVRDIAIALAERGIAVMRFNFAYTEAGRRTPDKMPKLLEVWRAAADAARSEHPSLPLFIGGRSMGGRASSHLAAEGYDCAGVVFLAYPLHPPGAPEKIRDAHLAEITQPILWLQGTKDTFAKPDLLHSTVAKLSNVTLIEFENADHSFKAPGRKAAEVTGELADTIAGWIASRA